MAAMSDRKKAEADEHVRNADKFLKTSFFKWKPDNDSAVSELQKAAVAYRVGKHYDQAIQTYLRCADIQKEGGSWFHAAKSLEAAGMIHKDQGRPEYAAELIEKASVLYLQNGTPDTAALALDRAAKIVEQKDYQRAVALYMRAMDVCEGEDRPRECGEMVGKAGRLLIRHRQLKEAAKAVTKEIEFYSQTDNHGMLNKLVMPLVLIYLHQEDSVAADQAFKSCLNYPGFAESDEAGLIQLLIESYDEGEDTTAYECIHNPAFRYMENEFTKLARDLRVPGGKSGTATVTDTGGATSYNDDDDEDEEGLL